MVPVKRVPEGLLFVSLVGFDDLKKLHIQYGFL